MRESLANCSTEEDENRHKSKKEIVMEVIQKSKHFKDIVGVALEVIQKNRAEKPEVQTKDMQPRCCKRGNSTERNKKTKVKKRAKKTEFAKTKVQTKVAPKGGKGPKVGGGGGKR